MSAGVKTYFEIVNHPSDDETIHLYLDELNQIPEEFKGDHLESKGFYEAVTIQDFHNRGKAVFIHVRKRRWINHSKDKQIVSRNCEMVAQGTRITKDFADFLKSIG